MHRNGIICGERVALGQIFQKDTKSPQFNFRRKSNEAGSQKRLSATVENLMDENASPNIPRTRKANEIKKLIFSPARNFNSGAKSTISVPSLEGDKSIQRESNLQQV